MKPYADLPARRARQIVADLLVLLWVVVWVRLGVAVWQTVRGALEPARRLESAGDSLQDSLGQVADGVEEIPLLGESISVPFESAAAAGETMSQVGADLVAYVERTALVAGVSTALLPIAIVVIPWLFFRLAFARDAGAVASALATGDALDLLALRALTTQPVRVLAGVSPTAASDWRTGRRDVVVRLAELELIRAGVAPPASVSGQ